MEDRGKETREAANRNLKTLYRIVRELSNTNTTSSSLNVPIKDLQGNVLISNEEQEARWIEHFRLVLNQPPQILPFDLQHIGEEAPEVEVDTGEITENEVEEAVSSLKKQSSWC